MAPGKMLPGKGVQAWGSDTRKGWEGLGPAGQMLRG